MFGNRPKAEPKPVIDLNSRHSKFGELTPENDYLSGAPGKAGVLSHCPEGAQEDDLPHSEARAGRRITVLGRSRGSLYHKRHPAQPGLGDA